MAMSASSQRRPSGDWTAQLRGYSALAHQRAAELNFRPAADLSSPVHKGQHILVGPLQSRRRGRSPPNVRDLNDVLRRCHTSFLPQRSGGMAWCFCWRLRTRPARLRLKASLAALIVRLWFLLGSRAPDSGRQRPDTKGLSPSTAYACGGQHADHVTPAHAAALGSIEPP